MTIKKAKKPELPKYCYARGNKIWVRYKNERDEWVNIPCGEPTFTLNQVDLATRFVRALLHAVDRKRERGTSDPDTVADYAKAWLADRDRRGLACAGDDRRRLERYALPLVGHIKLEQLKPRDVRHMVRELRAQAKKSPTGTPAPRTIHHVYNTLHTMMRSAIVEELYFYPNPVIVDAGELPPKIDSDREWRSQATFGTKEVVKLISSPIIPVERRVQYAIKSLTGARHGEMAALCWKHRDKNAEHLTRLHIIQAWDTRDRKIKDCKNGEQKAVPEHPVLTQILDAWHDVHWPRIYGRKPTQDDLIVPTRTMSCVDGGDANEAFKRDLFALGLRVEASRPGHGKRARDRGGHDLRAWYETQTVEDGADSGIIWRTTHAAPKTVKGGYERFSWKATCRELAKLQITLDGDPLQLGTHSLQLELKSGNRWRNSVTPLGLEPALVVSAGTYRGEPLVEEPCNTNAPEDTQTHSPVTKRNGSFQRIAKTAGKMLEKALLNGDLPRALQIARELEKL